MVVMRSFPFSRAFYTRPDEEGITTVIAVFESRTLFYTRPDEEGITTVVLHADRVRELRFIRDLMKKGLRPDHQASYAAKSVLYET